MYIEENKLFAMDKILDLGMVQVYQSEKGLLYLIELGQHESHFDGDVESVWVDVFGSSVKDDLMKAIKAEYEKQKYARENLTVISNVAGNPVIIEDLKFF